MAQVVTELVIDAAGAERGAQQYERAMDQVTEAQGRFNSTVQGMAVAVAAGVAGAVAAAAGLRAFVDQIGKVNKIFVDLDDAASRAGLSLKEMQQQLYAARTSGVSEKDFISGLDKIGSLLSDAGRGVTEFRRLFEANGKSVRDSNGELKSQKQIVAELAGLLQNSSPQVAEGIRRITGLSREWIDHLRKGPQAIDDIAKRAEAAGGLVDKGVIDKAREFNEKWNTAVAAWDLKFRASLASIMPLLQALANAAIWMLEKIGAVTQFFGTAMTPVDEMSKAQLQERFDQVFALRNEMVKLEETQQKLSGLADFKMRNRKSLLLGDDAADIATATKELERLFRLMQEARTKLVVTRGGDTNLPTKEEAADAVDRMLNSLNRHTLTQEANAKAVGLGARALAEFRAEASFVAAVQANGGKVTQDQINTFVWLKLAAGGAADAYERIKVAADIKWQRDTMFLSQDDVQIARQLAGIYGNDVARALQSTEAQALRMNKAFKEIGDGLRDIGQAVFSAMLQGKSGMDALVQAADRLASKLANSAFDNLLSGNPTQMGIGAVQAGASALLSLFGKSRREKEERARFEEDVRREREELFFRGRAIGRDTNTRAGAFEELADRQTQEKLALKHNANIKEINEIHRREQEQLNKEWDKRELAQQEQHRAEILRRQESFQDRLFRATNDDSTLEGALRAFDRDAQRERLAELKAGGEAINELEAALAAERLDIIKEFNDEAMRAGEELIRFIQGIAKNVRDYLAGLRAGPNSTLDPAGRLGAAQTDFDQQLALALSGDRAALGSITQFASTLLENARSFFASGQGYTNIYNAVTAGLEQVAALSPQTVVSNDNLLAAINATTTAVAVAGDQTTGNIEISNTILGGLSVLTDRIVNAINAIGEITASIGSANNHVLHVLHDDLVQLNGASGGGGGGTIWDWLGFARGGRVPRYAGGGIVGNGMWGVDSVLARYAGGGAIGLAGGEHVTKAPSVNSGTLPTLDFINQFGRVPSNDNAVHFRELAQHIARIAAAATSAQIGALREENAKLRQDVQALGRGQALGRRGTEVKAKVA